MIEIEKDNKMEDKKMDSLNRFQKMMQNMAHRESDACGDGRKRLERAITSVSYALATEGADEGYVETLCSSLINEIEHYDNLLARAGQQLHDSERLSPSVREITVPLVEQVKNGFLYYREAYQALYEGLYYGIMESCGQAHELGSSAEETLIDTWRRVNDEQYELPMVA
jgi:hypothetical protein